jgi:pimeloyl-ACP methyl ester carboxylesterase
MLEAALVLEPLTTNMRVTPSRDGTPIAFSRTGEGTPLLLVHGATADHTTTWRSVLPALERNFMVCAMDRRGRGESGDAPAYELTREAEDVAAVLDAIGGAPAVLGHSHGALCALEAALLTANVGRLILYEGVPLRGADDFAPGIIDRLETKLAAADVEGVLVALLREIVEMSTEEVELLRAQEAAWKVRLSNARSVPRELRAYERYAFAPERFQAMRAPTLLLVGSDSPSRELASAKAIAAALPDARVRTLVGQGHTAMHTAPEDFVNEVTRFLTE